MASEPASLSLLCLGTGRGSSAVYGGQTSSALVVLADARPLLLVDLGPGVTRACLDAIGRVPDQVVITHNHSDHAAELPVVLAVEAERGRRLRVIAGPAVMPRLLEHRLAELASTGHPAERFCTPVTASDPVSLGHGLVLETRRARHAEPCYGLVLGDRHGPILAYSGDSGYDAEHYAHLFEAPTVIVDARADGGAEHAGFDQVADFARAHPGREVRVTGHGGTPDAPGVLHALHPGERIDLQRASAC